MDSNISSGSSPTVIFMLREINDVLKNDNFRHLIRANTEQRINLLFSYSDDNSEGPKSKISNFISQEGKIDLYKVQFTLNTDWEDLLDRADGYLPNKSLTETERNIEGWKQGIAVLNSPDVVDSFLKHWGFSQETWFCKMEGSPHVVSDPNNVHLKYGSRINPRAVIINRASVRIGRGTLIGADCEFLNWKGELEFGNFCHTSSHLSIVCFRHTINNPTSYHVPRGPYAFIGQDTDKVEDVRVGNDVWLGIRITIVPGVRIADGCVVGAGSVVTDDLDRPFGIYAGNPAEFIRYRFNEETRDFLQNLEWWNWSDDKLKRNQPFFTRDLSNTSVETLNALVQ